MHEGLTRRATLIAKDRGPSASPAQHVESNTCPAVADEVERVRRGARHIDDDAVASRTAGGASVYDSYNNGSPVLQVRDADHRAEGIGGMSSDHRACVEPDAAGSGFSVETPTVI